jgi:hypothetical protein
MLISVEFYRVLTFIRCTMIRVAKHAIKLSFDDEFFALTFDHEFFNALKASSLLTAD